MNLVLWWYNGQSESQRLLEDSSEFGILEERG